MNTDVNAQLETLLAQKMTSGRIQPSYLKAGDTVAIVAPSGILKSREGEVQQAVALLKVGVYIPLLVTMYLNKGIILLVLMTSAVRIYKKPWTILK